MYRDTMKCMIIQVIIGTTSIVIKGVKKFGSHTRKTFNRLTIKDSYTRNITHDKESAAACNLKPERGSLFKRSSREKRPVTTYDDDDSSNSDADEKEGDNDGSVHDVHTINGTMCTAVHVLQCSV
jgi:hypothetical protein